MNLSQWPAWVRPLRFLFVASVLIFGLAAGCARLPYTTQVIHEDRRVVVKLEREIDPVPYSHPVRLGSDELSAALAGFSFREKQRLPLRWFAEEIPPKPIFRADEIQALAPFLAAALERAAPDERVHFQLLAPGMNPAYERDTTAGWLAVHEPYFHLTLEHYHAQFPVRKEEQWDLRYPALAPAPGTYLLYFEPGRFWVKDSLTGRPSVQLREFLKYRAPSLTK